MLSSPQVDLARRIATKAHAGQLDRIGVPYIQHPAMVASFVEALPEFALADSQTQQDALAAAWLHDVVEDTEETPTSLRAAGVSQTVVAAVVALTRSDDVAPDDYYAHLQTVPIARLVKTADLASNLLPERVARLDDSTRDRLDAKYTHALAQLGVDRSVITALHEVRPAH